MTIPGMDILDWILASSTVAVKLLMLRKIWWSPIFGVAIQSIWVTYAIYESEYGFLITPIIMGPLYATYVKKWWKERYVSEYIHNHENDYYYEELEIHPNWTPWDVPHWPDNVEDRTLYVKIKKKKTEK